MNANKLSRLFPNASKSFIAANCNHEDQGTASQPQRAASNEPLATSQAQEVHPGRITIRYDSFRRRFLDEENSCSKYHTDSLRYIGLIKDDKFQDVKVVHSQNKIPTEEEEYFLITIIYP